jgi:hypothetical protein
MPARADINGIMRTEPILTTTEGDAVIERSEGSYAVPAVSEEDAAVEAVNAQRNLDWENWFRKRLDHELAEGEIGDALLRTVYRMIDKALGPMANRLDGAGERVAKLEGGLAAMTAFSAAKSDQAAENAGATVDDLKNAFAVQAKRIAALELRLAMAMGAIDTLRARGVPGMPSVKGTFDPDKVYGYFDVVTVNGSTFIALKDGAGPCPGPDWSLLASAGRRGERGMRGPVGPRGIDAPTLSGVTLSTDGALVFRMSDGTRSAEIPLRHIFADVEIERADYTVVVKTVTGADVVRLPMRELFEQFVIEATANAARR